MAEHRPQSRKAADVRLINGTWKEEPPQLNRWRAVGVGLVFAALAASIVVADREWSWRDSLRRMANGEEIPAFRANEWANAASVYESLADELRGVELGSAMEDRATQRDLALYTLIRAAGDSVITRGDKEMWALMEELCLDVDWLEEIVCFCPMTHAETALPILAHIYQVEKKKMAGMPGNRRLAAAVAFEYALIGQDAQKALEAYRFYAASGQKHWLNNHFSSLALWQMRVIAARMTDEAWSNESTLTWFQRNCRLPSRNYVKLGDALGRHEVSLFGEPVSSPVFMALYRDADAGGTASIYEASGCSTALDRAFYSATAACANGVPALVAQQGDTAACLVDVNGKWESSAPLQGGMTCSWSFCGSKQIDFVQLASLLWAEKEKTLESYRLAHMGQCHYDAGNQPLAHEFFREALKQQPLNYAAWVAYRACGAPEAELAAAPAHFDKLPAVGAALRSQPSAE